MSKRPTHDAPGITVNREARPPTTAAKRINILL